MNNNNPIMPSDLISPGNFAKKMSNGKWILHKHLEYLDGIITAAVLAGNKKIIINMPPRHGKSCFLSEWFPLWYLQQFPESQIILATYNQRFATHWGRKVKDLIKEHGHALGLEIRKDIAAANNFKLNTNGGMVCIGVNGSLTGRGADLLLIDDPIKNDAEANSLTYRDAIWNWFNSTAYTRIEPNGTLILIMTRWHEDDLCGRLLQQANSTNVPQQNTSNEPTTKNEWILVKIPAIATENDALGRKNGEALWNDRFSIEKLNEIKMQIGEYWFAALYQQTPATATGNIFKRNTFKYFHYDKKRECYILNDASRNFTGIKTAHPKAATNTKINSSNDATITTKTAKNENIVNKLDCTIYAVVDLAATTKQTSDYTVILVFGATSNNQILVLDVIRSKFEGSEHLDLLKEIYSLWNPILIGIESVQYQISLIQMARKQNLPIKELKPDKDKVSRCLPIISILEAGKVFFHSDGDWLKDFEDELLAFPRGKHDDQVDAFGYITYMLAPIIDANNKFSLQSNENKRNFTRR